MNVKYDRKKYTGRPIANLKEMLNSSVELYKHNPAFLVKEKKGAPYKAVKYSQLKHDVDALGTFLITRGLKGAKVAIIGENCYEWIVTYLAVVNGVGVVVPLDKDLLKDEIDNLLNVAECKAVFYTDIHEKHLENAAIEHKIKMKVYGDRTDGFQELELPQEGKTLTWENAVALGETEIAAGDHSYIEMELDNDVMCALLFTSGTTGRPKGVMLSHKNIVSNLMDAMSLADIKEDDRTLSILPIHHTLECTIGMLFVLYNGASTAFCEGLKYVVKNMQESQVSILLAVPLIVESVYHKIWKQAEKSGKAKVLRKMISVNNKMKAFHMDASKKLFKSIYTNFGGRLRLIVTGAAAIDPAILRGIMDLGINVIQGYGLTETAPLIAATPEYGPNYRKSGSVGPIFPSGEVKIVNQDEGGIGEIVYRGPNVMLGYYKEPEVTAEVLEDGWFYTGDLGFIDEEDWLYVTGRKKNVIVTKAGKNIYPEELELEICKSKYIGECMVYGVDTGEDTVVTVQVRPDNEEIAEALGADATDEQIAKLLQNEIKEINMRMSSYKRIRSVIVRKDDFIKTATKKIQRAKNY